MAADISSNSCQRIHSSARNGVKSGNILLFGSKKLQGGSNMTGTNCDLFTHKSSQSYLNHLLLPPSSSTDGGSPLLGYSILLTFVTSPSLHNHILITTETVSKGSQRDPSSLCTFHISCYETTCYLSTYVIPKSVKSYSTTIIF
jgi:hypothetical protein